MTREKLQKLADEFSDKSEYNYLGSPGGTDMSAEQTNINNYAKNNLNNPGATPDSFIKEDFGNLAGMRFFERHIFSICKAGDPGFANIKRAEIVGEHHLLPTDWLPDAKSVISFFLPYSRATVEANKRDPATPPLEWLYTRVDGQRYLLALGAMIRDALIADGHKSVTPYTEDRFIMRVGGPLAPGEAQIPQFSSNWSERHVGVVTGLGTFGLSTNLITKAGCAGRLISIVTDWETDPDPRDYDDWLGYCSRCGACLKRCPAQAHLGASGLKNHATCGEYIRKTCEPYTPRYGCGKCQSGIPCEYAPQKPKKGMP